MSKNCVVNENSTLIGNTTTKDFKKSKAISTKQTSRSTILSTTLISICLLLAVTFLGGCGKDDNKSAEAKSSEPTKKATEPITFDDHIKRAEKSIENDEPQKAIDYLKIAQSMEEKNPATYDMLLKIYRDEEKPKSFNKQYRKASKKKIDIDDTLIDAGPSFNLTQKEYDRPVSLTIKADSSTSKSDGDLKIYYTINGKKPTKKSNLYEKSLWLDQPQTYKIQAVAYDKDGFMTKYTKKTYTLNVVSVNWGKLSYIGKTFGTIEKSFGKSVKKLGSVEGGEVYGYGKLGFIASWDDLIRLKSHKLKSSYKCVGITATMSELTSNVNGNMTPKEFANALGVSKYDVFFCQMCGSYEMTFNYGDYYWTIEFDTAKKDKCRINDSTYLQVVKK